MPGKIQVQFTSVYFEAWLWNKQQIKSTMKSLVFMALFCACAAFPFQYIPDTPEVQAERQRFVQLYTKAAQAAAAAPDINIYGKNKQSHYQPHQSHTPSTHRFNVPQPAPHHFGHNQAHFQPAPQHHSAPYQPKWTGPMAATVPAGLPGSVSQVPATAAVQAARANFGQAYQQQLMHVLG